MHPRGPRRQPVGARSRETGVVGLKTVFWGSVIGLRDSARNQIEGAIVMGIGMALFEETHYDPQTGQPLNNNLADYCMAVNADTPEIDVTFLDYPDLVVSLQSLSRAKASSDAVILWQAWQAGEVAIPLSGKSLF